jgi:HD-GYP domain-containing protein (c-di-GMP phosphodiesterase class II)
MNGKMQEKTNVPSATVHDLIQALAYATDMIEDVMFFHGWRVAVFGDWIARRIAPEMRQQILHACVLHDIGGVGLPSHILHFLKVGQPRTTGDVIGHPCKGAALISGIPCLFQASKMVMDHHERYDGTGFPRHKAGDRIPLGAQVIGIADELDIALHSCRIRSAEDIPAFLDGSLRGKFGPEILEAAVHGWRGNPLPLDIPIDQWIDRYYHGALREIGQLETDAHSGALNTTVEVFADVTDAKHPSTSGHSRRVARYSVMVGLAMDLSAGEISSLRWAALLHDIGKLSIPSQVLDKPTLLSEREYASMKRHVEFSKAILDRITDFEEISRVAYGHHERWDGSGYPLGLSGTAIPLLSRVLAVADTYDAMTSGRAYRTGLSSEDACHELQGDARVSFDPEVVDAAVPILLHLAD